MGPVAVSEAVDDYDFQVTYNRIDTNIKYFDFSKNIAGLNPGDFSNIAHH